MKLAMLRKMLEAKLRTITILEDGGLEGSDEMSLLEEIDMRQNTADAILEEQDDWMGKVKLAAPKLLGRKLKPRDAEVLQAWTGRVGFVCMLMGPDYADHLMRRLRQIALGLIATRSGNSLDDPEWQEKLPQLHTELADMATPESAAHSFAAIMALAGADGARLLAETARRVFRNHIKYGETMLRSETVEGNKYRLEIELIDRSEIADRLESQKALVAKEEVDLSVDDVEQPPQLEHQSKADKDEENEKAGTDGSAEGAAVTRAPARV